MFSIYVHPFYVFELRFWMQHVSDAAFCGEHAISCYQLYQTFLYKPNGALHVGDFHHDAANMALGFDVGG